MSLNQKDVTSFFLHSPIGVYIISNKQFVFANQRFQDITGFSESELLLIPPMELVMPSDQKHVHDESIQMLKNERQEPYHFRITDKAGNIRWITETVCSIQYQDCRSVLGHFMDTTDLRQVEMALRESERKYRSLFSLAREGIVIIRYEDGAIMDMNREFVHQSGYTKENLIQKKIWEIQPESFQDEAKEAFFRFRETCGGLVSWKLFKGKEGKILPVEIMAQRLALEGEDAILCMVRDISEREAMMRALRMASEEWRKSFDAIEDPILLINPDFEIIRANVAAASLLNMDIRNIIGWKCYRLFHGTHLPPDYCPHLKALTIGSHCDSEHEEPHLEKTLHFSLSPIKDEEGTITRSIEIISDVTFRKQQERESIRLSQALADSFQGITESLSDLAESRDPYTAGHSRHVSELAVLVGKNIGLSEEDLHGLRICALLHDIGKVIIPAAILNKPGRLSEHEWGLIRQHPKTAFDALQHIPFPWPVAEVVYQHHERLDGSGYPRGLKAEQIHLWARIIAVADVVDAMTSHRPYRPRMPRQNAFEELERKGGTLYDQTLAQSLIQATRLDDRRVMVIDDDTLSLELLINELKGEGLTVFGFMEPFSALEAFEQKPFPLVLIEMNLSGVDGSQVSKKIKEIHPDSEIIIITRMGGKDEMLRAIRAGASDFIEKPLDPFVLRKTVNRALHRFTGKVS